MIPSRRMATLLLGSGFCALVYQIAWFRALRLVFGASTAANAAVLAIFMGGLGIGGWLLGRRADRTDNPLMMYGNLELGIAGLAAISPFLIDLVRAGYIATGGTLALGSELGTLVRLVGAVLVLGGPVLLMGGTLPAATRACMAEGDTSRRAMATLYGANTFGSVAGAFIGTFFLIEILGTRNTLLAAACVNALIALSARAMARDKTVAPAGEVPAGVDGPAGDDAADGFIRPPARVVMAAAAVVGFAFFLMELVWYRMLGPILGGSSYTFGMILVCALLGIGVGGFLYSRRDPSRPVSVHLFALTCVAEALCFAVPLALGDDIAMWALFLQHLDHLGFGGLVVGWLAINALVVLPGAIIAGYQFPLLVALLGRGRDGVGRELGLTYAWNTVGSIVGSLAGGFGLLPLLGALGAWRMVVIVLLLLAALALLSIGRRALNTRALLPAALAALSLWCLMAPGPGAVWRHAAVGAGRAPASFDNRIAIKAWQHEQYGDIVWEVEGVESSVALNDRSGYAFVINGKTDGNARHDAGTQVMLGLLGAILHPQPTSGFVIGLGTGSSAGWLGKVPSVTRVDVVELEEAVLRVAEYCEPVNEAVLKNDRVNVIIGDAREVLPTTDFQYDLILSEPSNPYRAGIGSMFTQEFYQSVDERLAEGGIFLQWVQAYEIDARTLRLIYTTLHSVFPHIETWESQMGADLILVASREPLVHDLSALGKRVREEPFERALQWVWGVEGAYGLFTGFVANGAFADDLAKEAPDEICTDDNSLVEFGFARSVGQNGLLSSQGVRDTARARQQDRPLVAQPPGLDPSRLREWTQIRSLGEGRRSSTVLSVPDPDANLRQQARATYSMGNMGEAVALWGRQPQAPDNLVDRIMLAEGLALAGRDDAQPLIDAIAADAPTTAEALRTVFTTSKGDLAGAKQHLLTALGMMRQDPWPPNALMSRLLIHGENLAGSDPEFASKFVDALAEPFAAGTLGRQRRTTRLRVGLQVDGGKRCVEVLSGFEPHPPWTYAILKARKQCYDAAGHELADRATADLEQFVSDSAPRLFEADAGE